MDEAFETRQTLLQRVTTTRDDQSWEEFAHYYQKYIYLICRRMELSHHDAEEVVQKVLVKLWQKLPEMDSGDFRRFRAWLCTVTGCSVKDFIKAQARRSNRENVAGEDSDAGYSQPEIDVIAEQEWEHFIVTQALLNVKSNFSSHVLDVFHALHEGSSIRDVAEKFEIPPNTVSVYKRRVVSAMCVEVRRLERELG